MTSFDLVRNIFLITPFTTNSSDYNIMTCIWSPFAPPTSWNSSWT